MSESAHLADALQGLFGGDHGWFSPFTVAMTGLTSQQAACVPAPRMNSVWSIVNHVAFWHELVLYRFLGKWMDQETYGAGSKWSQPSDPNDEQAWQAVCQRAVSINKELSDLVAGLSDEALAQPLHGGKSSGWQVLHGLIAHTSYHTCEIISLRQLQGIWEERH